MARRLLLCGFNSARAARMSQLLTPALAGTTNSPGMPTNFNTVPRLTTRSLTVSARSAAAATTTISSVGMGDENLVVEWSDGGHPATDEFPFVWLRDNCQCTSCFHPVSKGRLFLMRNLNMDIRPKEVFFSAEKNKVEVVWPDGHVSPFDPAWLRRRSFSKERQVEQRRLFRRSKPIFFGSGDPIRKHNFDEIMESDEKLLAWLTDLEDVGLTLVQGLKEESLKPLTYRVAFPKLTHYGDFYIVESRSDPNKLAYTGATLELHLDQQNYAYTPGLGFFHCTNQFKSEGGDSEYADAFRVADIIRRNHPAEWDLLTQVPVHFQDVGTDEMSGDFHQLNTSPSIKLDLWGDVCQVCINTQHRDSIFTTPLEKVKPWYRALKLFHKIANAEDALVRHKMAEGECFVIDNLRVMHGRKGFSLADGGYRSLDTTFMDWDEAKSRRNVLENKLGVEAR